MSQHLKLIFKCFSKIKMHIHAYPYKQRKILPKCCQTVEKVVGTHCTPLFNFLSVLNGSHKIWGNSIIIISCARNGSSKFGLWECLRLASSLQHFLLKLSLPESVHPHTGHLHGWLPSQSWPYASTVIKMAFTRLIWGAGTPSKHLMKLPDSLMQVSQDFPVVIYKLKRTNISFVYTQSNWCFQK